MPRKKNIETFGRVSINRPEMARLFRQRRESMGLTIRDLALRAGVGATTIHSLEQGSSGINLETFLRVLAALELLPQSVLLIDTTILPAPATPTEAMMAELLAQKRYPELLRLIAKEMEKG